MRHRKRLAYTKYLNANFSFSKKRSANKGLKPIKTENEEEDSEEAEEKRRMKKEKIKNKGYNPNEESRKREKKAQANEATFER